MKRAFLLLLVIFISKSIFSQNEEASKVIEWKSFEEVRELFMQNQKPVLINFYTLDCDSCKLMMDSVFSNKDVVSYVNAFFYAINFYAKSQDTVTFFDGTKVAPSKLKTDFHPIVQNMLGKNPTFPNMIVFNKSAEGTVFPYYKSVNKLFSILIYYAEDVYKTTTYDKYLPFFNKTYPEKSATGYSMVRVAVKWKTLKEALDLNKAVPKRVFLDLHVNWKNTCTMMSMQTFNDPKVSEILNKYYYPVQLDANTKDTLDVFESHYINDGKYNGFHQLAVALLQAKMQFPALLFFDENSKLIAIEHAYFNPEDFVPVLLFYAENAYKTTPWQKFKDDYNQKQLEEKSKEIKK